MGHSIRGWTIVDGCINWIVVSHVRDCVVGMEDECAFILFLCVTFEVMDRVGMLGRGGRNGWPKWSLVFDVMEGRMDYV